MSEVPRARQPDPIDRYVGNQMRLRRTLLGMTQEQLAARLGVTFQQVQKYEKGTNRIGASRLVQIAAALKVPVAALFPDPEPGEMHGLGGDDAMQSADVDLLLNFESAELNEACARIHDPELRRRIVQLVRTIAQTGI